MPADSARALTHWIKAEARRLGFDLVGITSPDPPLHLDVYQGWLDAGRHGQMTYLATDRARLRRADPRRILPECQSILVLGANYLPKHVDQPQGASQPRVAAYALGDDYHDVLLERLETLVAALQTELGGPVAHRIYTDTGPLLERELAQRAGLGWVGKNTCLINPQRGSYFLLAELLLGVRLEPDPPFETDHCGSCTRCIDACPTACILPDRTLDARRCISYLTIELKAAIPHELRPQVGSWAFGCDVCQVVCPWNVRFASPTADSAFQPRPFLDPPDLRGFLELSPETMRDRLHASPLARPKRRGLIRNAAVVAGNSGDPNMVPLLAKILHRDPEPLARAHAAWALGQIGGQAAAGALLQAQRDEEDPAVAGEIQLALSSLGMGGAT